MVNPNRNIYKIFIKYHKDNQMNDQLYQVAGLGSKSFSNFDTSSIQNLKSPK